MTESVLASEDLPSNNEPAENLTYFAFANMNKADFTRTATKTPSGKMPDVLAGRYGIEAVLGAGGMGAVYRARDLLREQFGDTDPYVALKVFSEDFNNSPDVSALLYCEFALTQRVRHDNVVRMYSFDVDIDSQRAFVTMELLRGVTLDRLLCDRPSGLMWCELRDIALQMLAALACAHERGVIHGDVKPSNFMLCDEGVRLFDFGLSQIEQGALSGLPSLSRTRFSAWTPGYAASELFDGGVLTASADVFSIACVIYELSSGKHPFQRLPSNKARDQRLDRKLSKPENLPRYLWPILRAALAFDVSVRAVTAAQLRDQFKAGSSISRWCRRDAWKPLK